jgi:NADPH:quinone reductase-like Zn-dependent oxidoreductase
VLGADGAGVIAAVGSRVRRLRVGDRVYSFGWNFPKNGFYAEYVAVAADVTAKIPGRLDMLQAGAVPITALTALRGIDDILNLKRGETIIVHGASGGVGNMALQFAKLRGARVLATASGNDGVKLVRKLRADAAVEGHSKDITSAARQFAPHGVDAIFAAAGGAALTQCLDALRPGGRIAYPNGVEPEPKKRPKIKRTSYDAVAGRRSFEQLARAFKSAKIQVPIAAIFPLARAAEAHRQLAKGHVLGKIVLRIR